jgi:hypothetical protein
MIGTRHTFASYFAFAVDTILKVLWREGLARGPQELVRVTYNRIRRLERRFNALVVQWRAGTLPAVTAEPHTSPRPSPHSGEGEGIAHARAAWPFPRGRAWVVRQLVPLTGPACVGTLCLAWEDPEMAEFFAAAPQVGKILRPLAHMIGAPLPAWLKLPKRVRRRPPPRPSSARAGEGAYGDEPGDMVVPNRRLPAREQAEDAMRRSEASGKPIDLAKLKPEAFGWWAHPPRDGNCPPPKIGYAGRRRRPPKDYEPPRDD